jgi:hypothetical protein
MLFIKAIHKQEIKAFLIFINSLCEHDPQNKLQLYLKYFFIELYNFYFN